MRSKIRLAPRTLFLSSLVGLLGGTLPSLKTALAATYYVSPNGAGTGVSESSPRKAQTVLSAVRDGDTVIFLDGTYPELSLTAKDVGPGVITLRARQPILASINTASGATNGLRSTGAVLSGGGARRGLYIDGHNGLVVDGLKFGASSQGLTIRNTSNVIASRNHFHENSGFGIVVAGSSTAVTVTQNYFTNQRLDPVRGAYMDYGLYANNEGTLKVTDNLLLGRFNQGVALKEFITSARFTGNIFRCESGSCLMLGQAVDRLINGRLYDNTIGPVEVLGNKFENIGYVSIFNSNVEDVTISGNSFSNVSTIMYNKYDVAGADAATGGRMPRRVTFTDNIIGKNAHMLLEGRGTIGETVTISGNQINSPVNDCRTLRMSTASKVVGEQTAGYPTVNINNAGIACPQR